jgi:hypothetical protein
MPKVSLKTESKGAGFVRVAVSIAALGGMLFGNKSGNKMDTSYIFLLLYPLSSCPTFLNLTFPLNTVAM